MDVDGRETPPPKKKRKLSTYLPQWEKEAELAGWLTSSKRAPEKPTVESATKIWPSNAVG